MSESEQEKDGRERSCGVVRKETNTDKYKLIQETEYSSKSV